MRQKISKKRKMQTNPKKYQWGANCKMRVYIFLTFILTGITKVVC